MYPFIILTYASFYNTLWPYVCGCVHEIMIIVIIIIEKYINNNNNRENPAPLPSSWKQTNPLWGRTARIKWKGFDCKIPQSDTEYRFVLLEREETEVLRRHPLSLVWEISWNRGRHAVFCAARAEQTLLSSANRMFSRTYYIPNYKPKGLESYKSCSHHGRVKIWNQ